MIFGRLALALPVDLEPGQARRLDRVGSGRLIPVLELHEQHALETPPSAPARPPRAGNTSCSTAGERRCYA